MEDNTNYGSLRVHRALIPSEYRSQIVFEHVPELLRVQILTGEGLRWFIKHGTMQSMPHLARNMIVRVRFTQVWEAIEEEMRRIQVILSMNEGVDPEPEQPSATRSLLPDYTPSTSASEDLEELAGIDFLAMRT